MVKMLFLDDMLGSLDYILDWSVPIIGADLAECFEQEDEGQRFGYILFLRWKVKVDKTSLYKVAKDVWELIW